MELEHWLDPKIIWIVAGIVMLVLEFIVPGLIIFFFGAGAILTGIICMIFDVPVGLQFLIFAVSSVGSLVLLRKKFSGIFHGKVNSNGTEDDFDEIIGKQCKVVETISPPNTGKVEFRGTHWKASADEEIESGSSIEITGKENITLKVKKI